MNTASVATGKIEHLLDGEGFFNDAEAWNEDLAIRIAHNDGFPELTADHWIILHALREHYHRFGAAPPAFSHLCNEHHLGRHCVEKLFRSEREAWRIAGLPDPGAEAKAYM
ncbi:MAG TPA: TusE/DsrC/DsvC family sulfur relay protein [Gammaproteobacteria bacterium]|nr:TusE/DsrC/DsvC family sulfur relay protein [Gammaproteobacteria bacterium]